jgi:hypothetical protein
MTSLIKVKFSFHIGSYNTTAADKKHPYMVVNMRETSTKCILFFPMKDGCKPKNLCCGWPSYDHQEPLISANIHRHTIAKKKLQDGCFFFMNAKTNMLGHAQKH